MGLRDTYAHAIQTAKGKFHGSADERDGKLHFKGTVASEADKNEIWTAIKTIPSWQNRQSGTSLRITSRGRNQARGSSPCPGSRA